MGHKDGRQFVTLYKGMQGYKEVCHFIQGDTRIEGSLSLYNKQDTRTQLSLSIYTRGYRDRGKFVTLYKGIQG